MTEQWDYLFALAREIEETVAAGATVDMEKAWRLARIALVPGPHPPVTDGGRDGVLQEGALLRQGALELSRSTSVEGGRS